MKNKLWLLVAGLLLVGLLSFSAYSKSSYFGISNKALGVPVEFGQAEKAIDLSAVSPGAKYCPDRIVQARQLARDGVKAYWGCRTKDGLAMLNEAILLAIETEVCKCNSIYFDFDKADLKLETIIELDKTVKIMQENPNLKVELAGNTDSIGTEEYNIVLGGARAVAVYEYFKSKGLTDDRMLIRSYGEDRPVASNDTDEGRAKNRRVDFLPL